MGLNMMVIRTHQSTAAELRGVQDALRSGNKRVLSFGNEPPFIKEAGGSCYEVIFFGRAPSTSTK
ncbi:Glycosyltransferase [Caenorhabditis elegans]|uniref:Glycosyltransferase n=1 Tax=Caenorhabditis elegans TaxID=6239 RepID=A4UVL4_CAEEL|nr:Glycosyltransferase [Caenorhabditis elegans]CAM84817.1 Glycosyltransferase [Caenorhabditis elegans]|eukprot:NP_001122910.1 Uncharacterized protein CELE_F11D11.12 [Caenorhabditis elegans]